jgi:hypothetical protein
MPDADAAAGELLESDNSKQIQHKGNAEVQKEHMCYQEGRYSSHCSKQEQCD